MLSSLIFFFCFLQLGYAQDDAGCSLSSPPSSGLEANFFWYPFKPSTGSEEPKSWFLTGIKDAEHLGTQYNITQPNFQFEGPISSETIGKVYDFEVTIAHFAVEVIGYYRASATGNYTFQLEQTDDGCSFQVGLAPSASCCSRDFDSMVSENDMLLQYLSSPKNVSRDIYLLEGHYYPMRLAYYNYLGAGRLHLSVQKPGESEPSGNFEGDLFQPECSYDSPPSSSLSSRLGSKSFFSSPPSSKSTPISSTETYLTRSNSGVFKSHLLSSSTSSRQSRSNPENEQSSSHGSHTFSSHYSENKSSELVSKTTIVSTATSRSDYSHIRPSSSFSLSSISRTSASDKFSSMVAPLSSISSSHQTSSLRSKLSSLPQYTSSAKISSQPTDTSGGISSLRSVPQSHGSFSKGSIARSSQPSYSQANSSSAISPETDKPQTSFKPSLSDPTSSGPSSSNVEPSILSSVKRPSGSNLSSNIIRTSTQWRASRTDRDGSKTARGTLPSSSVRSSTEGSKGGISGVTSYMKSDQSHSGHATMGSSSSQSIPLQNNAARNALDIFTVGLVTLASFLLL